MSEDAHLRLDDVTKAFAGRTVLENIGLTLPAGELLTLLGPSGCGKTTALRIIAGFERPDTGQVRLHGRDITRVSAHRRNMGVVFQAYSLFPHMTALQNIGYGLRLRGISKARRLQRAGDLIDLMGLTEHAEKYPHQLSGGQKQRVALARSLATEPEVLLLDEPLSALDAQVRVQLRGEIRRIQRESAVTTIMVTHDQEEALTIADRVAVMHAGTIQQIGPPGELYRSPANDFVSGFLGAVNRIRTTVHNGSVQLFGHTIPSRTHHAPGTTVWAHVRPEDITLTPDPQGDGEVEAIILRGATTSVEVRWPHLSQPVRIDIPTREAVHFDAGTTVTCTVEAPEVLTEPLAPLKEHTR
ncbi:ABC transporter ATP-binding protein [Nesterenkonia alba]|uniref:ABC transporter ATP-binding protein n=1 Tax=Nesterenkonia alba TaxID=515814 RepID=UPI0003B460ED|nr:ABC transporter ATP-binding protein [Nesterenkonia alba]